MKSTDIKLIDYRHAAASLLVAVGHKGNYDADNAVQRIVKAGSNSSRLYRVLRSVFEERTDRAELERLLKMFRNLFRLTEAQLLWSELYKLLETYVVSIENLGYMAVGSHRLVNTIRSYVAPKRRVHPKSRGSMAASVWREQLALA